MQLGLLLLNSYRHHLAKSHSKLHHSLFCICSIWWVIADSWLAHYNMSIWQIPEITEKLFFSLNWRETSSRQFSFRSKLWCVGVYIMYPCVRRCCQYVVCTAWVDECQLLCSLVLHCCILWEHFVLFCYLNVLFMSNSLFSTSNVLKQNIQTRLYGLSFFLQYMFNQQFHRTSFYYSKMVGYFCTILNCRVWRHHRKHAIVSK